MIWPAKMLKLRFYALESRSYDLVSKLHELGVLHLKEAELEGVSLRGLMPAFDKISGYLNLLSPLEKYVDSKREEERRKEQEATPLPLRNALNKAEELSKTGEELRQQLQRLEEIKREVLNTKEEVFYLQKLVNYGIEYDRLPSKVYGFISSKAEHKGALNIESKDGLFLVLIQEGSSKPEGVLFEFPKSSPKKELKEKREYLAKLEKEAQAIEKGLEKKVSKLEGLKDVIYSLRVHAERSKAFSNFAGTERVVIIEGWIPEKHKKAIVDLEENMSGAMFVEWLGEDEKGPTLIENPKVVKPFELAYSFSSLPKAGEMNASFFYALTFPFIYGMIIGDVLYSLIAIAIMALLRRAFPSSKTIANLSYVWTIAALGGVLWGIVFDEWLGASHMFYIEKAKEFGFDLGIEKPLYKGIHRLDELPLLLGLSGIVAIFHLTLGSLLGAYTAFKHGHKKHGLARLGWAISFLCFGLFVSSYMGVIELMLPSALGLVVGVALIYAGEGVLGIFELPSLASNSASYFRIAAVGIAGVVLAEIINEYLFPSPSMGVLGMVVLFIIFLILQSINAFIAAFESTVQGGRLEILEFRSKFVEGGGKPYSPFALKKR